MSDLLVGYLVVALMSAAACGLGARFAYRHPGALRSAAAALMVLLTVAFAAKVQGHLIMARWIPFSNVVLIGNWTTLGAACLAGMLFGWSPIPPWRRLVSGIALLIVGIHALNHPLPDHIPQSTETWTNGVCLQSTPASCSACSAATLLTYHGVPTNETEMIELCLTGGSGTPTLGLYRGLKLKTRDAPFEVEPFFATIDELLEAERWPAILLVKLEIDANVDPRYERQWGWTPGVGHAVVVFGPSDDGRLEVGDPSVGLEHWSLQDLAVLWQGEGLRLRPE